ncbi:MAG: hypothetical protein N2589_00950 [bacterium]|nr:hypothetical protein [bacterium]MCX7916685.1 hypothetical protein [bacterium]MDW8164277.1 hypothetical protein [Candidatus Omnitrophota bacterium]
MLKNHIKNFKKIPTEEKILWTLSYGWFLYENLPEEKKKIFNKYRNGWKERLKKK